MKPIKIILIGSVIVFIYFTGINIGVCTELPSDNQSSIIPVSTPPTTRFIDNGLVGYIINYASQWDIEEAVLFFNKITESTDENIFYINHDGEKLKVLGIIGWNETPASFKLTHIIPSRYIRLETADGGEILYDIKYWINRDDGKRIFRSFFEGDIPWLLEALIFAESSNNPLAVSSSGARGLTQIKSIAWADLVRVYPEKYSNLIYERDIFNPDIARQAGADYLKIVLGYLRSYRIPATLDNILAAYNWGIDNLRIQGLQNAPPEIFDYIGKITNYLNRPL